MTKDWKKEFDKRFPNKNIDKYNGRHLVFLSGRQNINLPIKIKLFITKLLKEQSKNKQL